MKLKCKKCGNENLSFVSVTIQDGKDDILFTCIGWLNIIIFAIGCIIILCAIAESPEHTGTFEDTLRFITVGAIMLFIIGPLTIAFFCFSFKKLMPYATHDEIKYVCPCCGHIAKVKEIKGIDAKGGVALKTEAKSTEAKETDTEEAEPKETNTEN